MLPSAGIFSRIPCPYFEEGHCVRPFCEFFHKPPDEDEPSEKPSYRPTPIAIPALDTQDKEEAGQIKKRPKLEYIPLPVTIKPPVYKPSVIPPVATYIPTKITPEIVEETPEKADEDLDKSLELVIDEGIETNISAAEIQESNSETDIKKEKKSSRRHSHSSSKSSRHHKSSRHESSSSSSSRHHKSSRHKSSSRRSSSSSKESSSRKHKSKSDKSSKPTEKPKEEPIDLVASEEENEEDIEEQCRMIFETYQAPEKSEEIPQQPKPSKSTDSEESSTYVNDKKRLAHENSANVERPTTSLRTNHSHSALKLAHKRQDIAMQSALEELQRKNEEIQRLEAEIKKRQEEKEALTPLVNPLVFHRAKARPVISKISQIMQIEAAKKRVADLNKAKADRFQSFTPSQTANKWSNRTAHTPTNISDIDPLKLAPPFKEPNSSKISSNVRNQYYKIMVTHCLQIYSLPEDAYERAQNEEYTVFQKCKMVQTYKTSALLAISRLKKEAESGSAEKKNLKTFSHDVMLAGKQGLKNSWSTNHKIKVNNSESSLVTIDNCSSSQAYSLFAECILTEQQLKDNGFPRATEMAGKAKIFTPKKAKPQSAREGDYYCSRCHKVFNVEIYDEPGTDMCNFHAKRSGYRRGFADNLYYCCQQPVGSDGCGYANYHVTDYVDHDNLLGYVRTMEKDDDYVCTKKDIFALDCEMCYTDVGLELTRITVISYDERVVYDKFVKPQNRVIDYNTKYSGITEETLNAPGVKTIMEIQAVLLSMFHSRTILVGHSLESDLKALKIIHGSVVDTSVLYPHKMGPPKKRALKTLCNEYLKKIIQEDEAGHDSAEDALVTIQLVKCYLRNRIVN